MRQIVIVSFIITIAVVAQVNADCIQNQYGEVFCGRGKCQMNRYGKVFCAQRYGDIMMNRYGDILCGTGHCKEDYRGDVWCSVEEDGSANIDMYGKVKCFGGCETGNLKLCDEGQQAFK
jgi:hypothetical protein